MEIIFQGRHTDKEAADTILGVIRLFKERYQISEFREIHLSVTLIDKGEDVELVDSETGEAFRVIEVWREGNRLSQYAGYPSLKLVIDNTKKNKVIPREGDGSSD